MNSEKYAATREWIEQVNHNGNNDDNESTISSSIVESTDDEYDGDAINITALGTQIESNELVSITQSIKELFNAVNSVQTVGNVNIENSTGVHIGNVTNINGNIQIIHANERSRTKDRRRHVTPPATRKFTTDFGPGEREQEERVSADAFIDRTKFKIPRELCSILPRHTWLAQCPMEAYDFMQEPVQYVVISHTATESSEKQAINIRIVRDVQCFHIESRGWNDIAYNFLIGCDGNIYQGRGWGVIGAHTMGYNKFSIGIAFIGCFMRELPSTAALTACRNLLKKGVDEGRLSSDYRLVTAAQCRSTESPGRRLIEELQTWEHFYKIEEEEE